jgi:hypothetical protein
MTRSRRYLCLLLSVPGLLVIVLPFAGDAAPLDALRYYDEVGPLLACLAAASLLAIPIALWHVRSLFGAGPSVFEQGVAVALSAAAMSPVYWVAPEFFLWSEGRSLATELLLLALPFALVLFNVAWLARSLLKKQPFQVAAERFLVLGYVPNISLALLLLQDFLRFGAAVAGIACACCLGMVVLLSADRTPDRDDVDPRA